MTFVGAVGDVHTTSPITAFAPGVVQKAVRPRLRVLAARSDRQDNDDFLITAVDKVAKTVSSTTPILDIPLGYPLVLLTATALFPWITSLLLNAFFGAYLYLGRRLLTPDEDDESDEILPLVALVGAIASAGLLSPDSFDGTTGQNVVRAVGAGFIGLAAATVGQSLNDPDDSSSSVAVSPEEELLNLWDNKFKKREESAFAEKKKDAE